ncbi:Sodium/glucose cotransporter [Pseudobythopirellula maris]|uniref:Sodium/glucose cotransporter n=1 Tax=Pseudobythopirellula maris TaxID=2527991 RepID=A0A5C5ZJL3_9BACT|nr:sodium/solute symporter [Pseudobythopirellula maris]TWT87227.1 Sodium/glucose cotransporter [Pseudobythopirellula maris]
MLSGTDAVVLLAYLGAAVAIGLFFGSKDATTESFFLGKREISWFALLLSIVATETSTVTFLSLPGQSFAEGGDFRFLQLTLGYIIGRLVVAAVLLPEYFGGEFFTAHEVLHKRFGSGVQVAAATVFLIFRNGADGLRLFLTALVLEAALDVNFFVCVAGIAVATAVYSAVGGVSSVVWNDCIQFVVYITGAVIALMLLVGRLPDGWATLSQFAADNDKLRLFDLTPTLRGSGITLWSGLIGGAFLSLASHGADHMMVQRYLCAGSRRNATLALALSGPLVAMQFAFFLAMGVALACFYSTVPTEHAAGTGDRVFINFLVHEMPSGLRGLVLAAVIAAAMSTLSSSLNASAGAFVKDLLGRFPSGRSEAATVVASRVATFVFAAVQAAVAMAAYRWAQGTSVIETVLAIAGFSTGLLLGLYALGLVWRRASDKAGLVALAIGFGVCLLVVTQTEINWTWYTLIGSATTFFTGAAVLLIAPPAGETESVETAPAEAAPAQAPEVMPPHDEEQHDA